MSGLWSGLKVAFGNFGPIIVFYAANHFWGLKPAVLISLGFALAESSRRIIRKEEIGAFFAFSAALTVILGGVDLYLRNSVFFKYEAAVTNLFTGAYFAASLFGEKTLIQEFAEKSAARAGRPLTDDHAYLFRVWTGIWVAYFALNAGVYVWVASRYTLEQGLVIRAVFGNGSMYALILASMFGSKRLMRLLKDLRLLPSCRTPSPSGELVREV